MMTLKEFQTWFEKRFLALLEEKSATFLVYSNNSTVKEILSYINIYAQGGKRFRPYMVYIGYTAEGGEHDIFSLLASIEFLHLFCLVHDDLIDDTHIRHDVATLHIQYQTIYNSIALGRAVALLVGDLLLAWSVECLRETETVEPYTVDDAGAEYRELLSEVIHGQMLDIVLSVEEHVSKEIIEKKMTFKSAHYSFFRPLYIGMVLAGADTEVKKFAEEYATSLGLAFQMQDDINDVVSDVQAGQQTLISWYMNNEAAPHEKKEFEKYFAQEWSADDEHKLMRILQQSGALSFAEEKTEQYFLEAEDAIFNHDKNGEEIWQEIIEEVRKMS